MPLTLELFEEHLAKSEASYELGVESGILYITLLPKGIEFASSTLYVPFMSGVKDLCKVLLEGRRLVTIEDDGDTISHIGTLSLSLDRLGFYRKGDILKATKNQFIGFVVTHFSDELTLKAIGVYEPSTPIFIFRTDKAEYERNHFTHESTLSGCFLDRLEEFWKGKRGPNEIKFLLTDKGVLLGGRSRQGVPRSLHSVWDLCNHLVKDCGQYMDLSPDRDNNPGTSCSLEELDDEPFVLLLIEGIRSGHIIPSIRNRKDAIKLADALSSWLSPEELSKLPFHKEENDENKAT